MRTIRALVLLVASCTAMSANARQLHPPEQIVVEPTGRLQLAAQARRSHLLGAVDLYTVAIYGAGAIDRARLASVDVAKALRIDVTYIEDIRRRVALDWRGELVPRLEPAAVAHLRGVFAPLQHGDAVQVEYVPAKGTIVRVNKAVAVSGAHHDLMLAFLDHWLGERPLSEEIKRMLLASL
ncbi:MAG TPA: chalcone isomerase family protein [Vicinamibacterales bacterium]|nr:chalcone isomerase family protein [Vicinamibacterales bacterium]